MNIAHEEKIIIDKSYFKRKDNQNKNSESRIEPSTLEEILDSIYQQEYLDSLDLIPDPKTQKELNSSTSTFKAKKKYFN
jgi:hypothetical protein